MGKEAARGRLKPLPDLNAYRERWVAVVRGRVVGVGAGRTQAYRAAKRARPKEEPRLFYVSPSGEPLDDPAINLPDLTGESLLAQVVRLARARQVGIYLVGGAVRDSLLGRTTAEALTDLDFATPGDGLALARAVADSLGGAFYPLDDERGTGRVVLRWPGQPATCLDFATFRGGSLLEDLTARDFTVNAIALDLSADPPALHDPLDGRADLAAKRIRVASPRAIADDPVRMLRAVRLAAALGFAIESGTEELIRRNCAALGRVSAERVRDELMKSLASPRPAEAVADLHRLGLLAGVLPEVAALEGVTQSPPHHLPVFEHSLAAVRAWAAAPLELVAAVDPGLVEPVQDYLSTPLGDGFSYRDLITLAVLLHDIGKPATRTESEDGRVRFFKHDLVGGRLAKARLGRLRFSREAATWVATVVTHHMRPLLLAREKKLSRRAIYRYFRATDRAGVAVALLALADHQATRGREADLALAPVVKRLCQTYFEEPGLVRPKPLLTGQDLITGLGLAEGPLIGQLLAQLLEAQATGEVQTRDQALAFLSRLASEPDFAKT